jgi:hypothetical protein
MPSVKLSVAALVPLSGCASAPAERAEPAAPEAFADTFAVDPGDWSSTGTNPYFILEPGYRLTFEGREHGRPVRLVITVLDETRTIDGVETRVVEERESEGDELSEVSRNYFAISKKDRGVYYFGEDVDEYEDGRVAAHGGSWHAGENGARFGLMMPGTPVVGLRHYQEVAPGVAMDRAEVVSLTETVDVPAGTMTGCLRVKETTPLEKATEFKLYAPGVGLVQDGPFRLVAWQRRPPP